MGSFHFCLLGSGSSGNAALVASDSTRILIDNGFSLKQLKARMAAVGESVGGLNAVFVTHEHADHVRGVGVLARALNIPVFMTAGTRELLPLTTGEIPNVVIFEAGDRMRIRDLEVASFSVPHDAADPVSFTVSCNGCKVGFATDFGKPSQLIKTRLAGANALVIESNYCPDMLRMGHYPPQVQQRIRSRIGHLSNQDMCSLLDSLWHEALRTVVLMHISENNNRPELARAMAAQALRGRNVRLFVAAQDAPTPVFEVEA